MIHPPFWLTPNLALIIRPYGEVPIDEHMRGFREAGINVIVSMLQKGEARNLGLEDEEAYANKAGLLFENFPIADGSVPSNQLRFTQFLEGLENHISEGRKIAIHCRASIGRAPLTAASLLIRSGMTPDEVWSQIATIRDCPVPDTPNQRRWVDTNIKAQTIARSQDVPRNWTAEILETPPLIAPVRQFTYPQQIAGEEDALARGALLLLVRPASGGMFLATCALGFTDPTMPTGLYACPNPDELCAVAGGYAYIINSLDPTRSTHIALKPVVEVREVPSHNLILFVGFHTVLAYGSNGEAWQTSRLSWEGLRISSIEGDTLHGIGWNMLTNNDVPFTVDLRTGQRQGGGYP